MLARGTEIKGYRIEGLLGRGGMGEVYEATQLELGRRVALKVLHIRPGDDADFRERFRREGRLQAALDHPNIVTVYEAGELDDGLFLAMRLVEGVTLKQLIAARELDAGRTLRILAPVAEALDAAHAAGLVHRDVKPQNILVDRDDRSFLADFGLMRGEDQPGLTRSGQIFGTIDYIAPEQARGEPPVKAGDVYAFSAVLFECLSGSVPFVRPTATAVLLAHISAPPPKLSTVRGDLPAGLDAVLARGLAKEPDERPASAGELVSAAAAELGGEARASLPPAQSPLAQGVRAVSGETTDMPGGGATGETARLGASRRALATSLGALGLAVLAALAFFGGRAAGGGEAGKLTTSVAGNALSLRAPADWEATAGSERPAVPGLELRDEIGVAPAARDASGAIAGMTAATGARLLPAKLTRRTVGGLPRPAPVKLGKLEALRYRGVRVRGFDRELTLYAAPSSAGVATIACYSPSAGGGFAATCERVAAAAELLQGHPYPLATSPQTERALDRIVATLRRERAAGRRRLARAGTDAAQATAATRVARADAGARRRLERLAVSPALAGSVGAARSATAGSAAAYGSLAAAASEGDAERYDAARGEVEASEARLARALAALGGGTGNGSQ